MTRRASLLCFNALLLATVPLVIEGVFALRILMKALPADGLAGDTRITWGHEANANSWGYRDREFEHPKPRGVFRVALLGDSITWGAGVDAAERYGDRAAAIIRSRSPEQACEFVNLALEGFDTTREYDTLYRMQHVVEPDLVVLGFCYNDTQRMLQEYSPERERLDARTAPWKRMLAGLDAAGLDLLASRCNRAFLHIAEALDIIPSWIEALDRSYAPDSTTWSLFERSLAQLADLAMDVTRRRPVFLILRQGPSSGPLAESDLYFASLNRWYEQAAKAAAGAGFDVVDCASRLPAADTPAEWYRVNAEDAHPSAELHEIFAGSLETAIGELLQAER